MTNFNELQEETREIITDLLNDGSDPDALYIIEHHIAHYDFDTLEKIAVDAFKAGYEVSEAEEFEDESGKVILKIRMPRTMNTAMTANFLTMKMSKTTTNVYINNEAWY